MQLVVAYTHVCIEMLKSGQGLLPWQRCSDCCWGITYWQWFY